MKRLYSYIIFVLFLNITIVNAKDRDEWQKISNSFYSLEVPPEWRPCDGSPEMIPGERNAKGFKIHFLAWWKPSTYEERNKTIGLDIQSYARPDGNPVSLSEMEKLIFINVDKDIISDSKTEKIYSVVRKSKEMDGSTKAYRYIYVLSEKDGMVHVLNISTSDSYYQSSSDVRRIIKRIMDSIDL